MMKTLILGDIHGRTIWKEIIEKENPDKVIFLGDYVDTHHLIFPKDQIENLEEILKYKEENPNKVILLRGNHDLSELGYYWAECSGKQKEVLVYMSSPDNKERYLKNTKWIYVDEDLKTIFSHAGISKVWLDETVIPYLTRKLRHLYDDNVMDNEIALSYINDIEPCEVFGFIPDSPFDMYGESETQSLVWIRPGSLAKCCIDGYIQVVGHTPVKRECVNIKEAVKSKQDIWLCDALNQRNYLVIEDGEFKHKGLL